MKIQVVISGRHYNAAEAIPAELTLPDGTAVDEALRALDQLLPGEKGFPGSCLVAVSGVHLGTVASHRPHVLRDGDELLVLAPVAGG